MGDAGPGGNDSTLAMMALRGIFTSNRQDMWRDF
jgi:hypothetical protein